MKIKNFFLLFLLFSLAAVSYAQKVDYSVVSVPEESGMQFIKVSKEADYVCMPIVKRNSKGANWFTNHIIDISPDGSDIAYISMRNNATNIFIKALDKHGASEQRTNRSDVLDLSYSPDGKYLCFSEKRGKTVQIFQTSATNGYVCRQITSNNSDYSPVYSHDMSQVFFARQEAKSVSIWSYDVEKNFLSTYTTGMNPCLGEEENVIICTRVNNEGRGEIWRINYETGVEECIVADAERSFTSPRVSPCGRWILFVGSSKITTERFLYWNTDIYVAKTDGTDFSQLTYHAADDLSPVWSKDGEYIYFISQRGSADGSANIWRMSFNLH